MSGTRFLAMKAPATDRTSVSATLVIAVHGIRGRAGGAVDHAERIAARCGRFVDVRVACLKGTPELGEVVADLAGRDVILAPLVMAEGYTLKAMKRQLEPIVPTLRSFTTAAPLGVHPSLADRIVETAKKACRENKLAASRHGSPDRRPRHPPRSQLRQKRLRSRRHHPGEKNLRRRPQRLSRSGPDAQGSHRCKPRLPSCGGGPVHRSRRTWRGGHSGDPGRGRSERRLHRPDRRRSARDRSAAGASRFHTRTSELRCLKTSRIEPAAQDYGPDG